MDTRRIDPKLDGELFHTMMGEKNTRALRAGLRYYPRFVRMLGSYVRFKLGPRVSDWEDVLQNVLTSAFEARDRAPIDGRELRRWIFAIARATCFNTVTRGHSVEPLPEIEPVSTRPGPETQVRQAEEKSRVRAALKHLPPNLAQFVQLRYLDDWSVDAIADLAGVQTRFVRRHLDEARSLVAWELTPRRDTRRATRKRTTGSRRRGACTAP